MAYFLQRIEDGKYVALPGSERSYTSDITKAARYPSRPVAKGAKCGNERIVYIDELLQPTVR